MSHLFPPHSVFDSMPHIASHELAVTRWLGVPADTPDVLLTTTFCLPSFDADWAVFLMRSRDGQHFLQHARTFGRITANDQNVKVERLSCDIETEWADRISNAICSAVADVRNADAGVTLGCDGTDFHFSASHPTMGTLAGKTWSPANDSIPGQLVALADGMRDFCLCSAEFQYRARARMTSALDWLRDHQ